MVPDPAHTDALAAFIARKAEVDELLARLAALSDEHFGFTPDEVNWRHAVALTAVADSLKQVLSAAQAVGARFPTEPATPSETCS